MQLGAHVPEWGKTEDVWERVNISFFDNAVNADIKTDCFNDKNWRKIKDKFEDTKKEILESPEFKTVNLSANDSENIPILHRLVKQIQMEIEERKENSTSKKTEKDQARLVAIENAINTRNPTVEPTLRVGTKRDPTPTSSEDTASESENSCNDIIEYLRCDSYRDCATKTCKNGFVQ
jgi:hypothetical protein